MLKDKTAEQFQQEEYKKIENIKNIKMKKLKDEVGFIRLKEFGYTKKRDDDNNLYYEKCMYFCSSKNGDNYYSYIQIDCKTRIIINNNNYNNKNYDVNSDDIKDLINAGLVEEKEN